MSQPREIEKTNVDTLIDRQLDQEHIRRFFIKRTWFLTCNDIEDLKSRKPLSDDQLKLLSVFVSGYELAK